MGWTPTGALPHLVTALAMATGRGPHAPTQRELVWLMREGAWDGEKVGWCMIERVSLVPDGGFHWVL